MTAVRLMVIVLMLVLLALSGCDDRQAYAPRVGDYGTVLVSNIHLNASAVAAMNSVAIKPFLQAEEAARLNMAFQAQAKNNPYRFVMVVRGSAVADGSVDLRFIHGVSADAAFSPKVLKEEDDSKYHAGERVLLVLASEPFSVRKGSDGTYHVQAFLSERDNIDIDALELQVWQGVGRRISTFQWLSLAAVIFAIIGMAYRIATRR